MRRAALRRSLARILSTRGSNTPRTCILTKRVCGKRKSSLRYSPQSRSSLESGEKLTNLVNKMDQLVMLLTHCIRVPAALDCCCSCISCRFHKSNLASFNDGILQKVILASKCSFSIYHCGRTNQYDVLLHESEVAGAKKAWPPE
jgi:hypothetical protein